MKGKILSGKLVSAAMVLTMALNVAFFFVPNQAEAAAPEITESYVGYYDQYHNGELKMHYRAKMHKVDGQKAYCISMTKTSEPGAAKEVNIKKYLPGDELVMACLAQKHIFEMESYTTEEKYMLTQCMVWYIQRDHIGDGGWRQYVSGIDLSVSDQKTFFSNLEKKVKEEAKKYEGHGTAWQNIDIEDVQEVGILLAPTLKTGDLALKKTSAGPTFLNDNQCYSLEGAQYGVYSDEKCENQIAVLTTDHNGNTEKVTVEVGTYYIKEIKASKGYLLDSKVYSATVEFGETKLVSVKEIPGYSLASLSIEKIDKETGRSVPQGEASLEGAEFTICYYDSYFENEEIPDYEDYHSSGKRKWIIKTIKTENGRETIYSADLDKDECKVEGDDYYWVGDQKILPLGTVTVKETKPPKGYSLQNSYIENVRTKEREEGTIVLEIGQEENGKEAVFLAGNQLCAANQIIRGDLALRKVLEKDDKALAGVTFCLTSVTTGESHVFMTDENGEYNTSSSFVLHSAGTNEGKQGDGIWFGIQEDGTEIPVDNQLGALPYDTYELEELPGENNHGMLMYKDTVTVRKENQVVHLNNLENHIVPEEPIPKENVEQQPEKKTDIIEVDHPQIKLKKESVKTGDFSGRELFTLVVLAAFSLFMILSCVAVLTCGRIAHKD